MAFSRKGCYKCGNLGHIAENCSSEQRLCYNCRQPGHESNACPSPRSVAAKQCYSCGGIGHIQAECPSLRVSGQGGGQKCYVRKVFSFSSPSLVPWTLAHVAILSRHSTPSS
ncbi:hypothetical protein EXIGLDRAFT_203927 [Exidia glandulosa HHB12029]|uniref:CCHC-type domain-containing protein n=1 Tax=Exidia glandulosa HHB12029 TaxID=1314781 RepID=A0A165ENH4_EXIGL|nr:hypothetical protein EXIGLDRAFT_203927 [Exidia glandulosa HHB12029]